MRAFCPSSSRATSAAENLTRRIHTSRTYVSHPKPNTEASNISNYSARASSSVRGKSPSISPLHHSNTVQSTSNSAAVVRRKNLPSQHIDHRYISQILSRKDWHLLVKHEIKSGKIVLNLHLVVSILQNQEDPLNCIKFYVWVLNHNPLFDKNQRIRGVLSDILHRKGPVLLSIELVEDIRSSGCVISEDCICILFGSWGRLGLAKYCTEIFGQISYLGFSPTTRLYNALLDALVKSNALDMAYLKFQHMPADNCKPDRFTYNILIHGVCKAGVVEEGLRLIRRMETSGYKPNIFTYTILVDGYCNANRVDDAFRLLETIKLRNVNPSDATYRSLVHGVFRSLEPTKAYERLSEFVDKEPSLPRAACDTILYRLANNGMAREAAEFLRKLCERGYLPDNSTFNITMTCLVKVLSIPETCQIVDSFSERGLKLDINSYLRLIKSCFREEYSTEGSRYISLITQAGLVSNVFVYNMLIDCLVKAKMIDMASKMFSQMQQEGIAPELATFNTLIDGRFKAGDIGMARELLVKLLEEGFKPDIFTFSSIIDGLCRANKIEDAKNCFMELVEWGVVPSAVTYNILIRALCVRGYINKALALFRKMRADGITPDVYTFNMLIQSFCRTHKVEKAQKLFTSMLTLGLTPDNITYSAFIKCLCDIGRIIDAKELFFSMEATGCAPDSYTCKSFVDTLVKLGCSKEVQHVMSKCRERGVTLNLGPDG